MINYYHFGVKWMYIASQNGNIKASNSIELIKQKYVPANKTIANLFIKGKQLGILWLENN